MELYSRANLVVSVSSHLPSGIKHGTRQTWVVSRQAVKEPTALAEVTTMKVWGSTSDQTEIEEGKQERLIQILQLSPRNLTDLRQYYLGKEYGVHTTRRMSHVILSVHSKNEIDTYKAFGADHTTLIARQRWHGDSCTSWERWALDTGIRVTATERQPHKFTGISCVWNATTAKMSHRYIVNGDEVIHENFSNISGFPQSRTKFKLKSCSADVWSSLTPAYLNGEEEAWNNLGIKLFSIYHVTGWKHGFSHRWNPITGILAELSFRAKDKLIFMRRWHKETGELIHEEGTFPNPDDYLISSEEKWPSTSTHICLGKEK